MAGNEEEHCGVRAHLPRRSERGRGSLQHQQDEPMNFFGLLRSRRRLASAVVPKRRGYCTYELSLYSGALYWAVIIRARAGDVS